MAKKGMKRPEITQRAKNDIAPVPELQGSAKHTKEKAPPIIAETKPPSQKVWHTEPYSDSTDKPVSDIYPAIDTDLARDNIENDLTAADAQDL